MDRLRAVGGAAQDRRGRLRLCAGARRGLRLQGGLALRPRLFPPQGRQGGAGRRDRKGIWGRMRVKPEEGLDVIVSGKLAPFAGSSKYQIVIDTLEPAGIGALMKLLEERKKKLATEGLFDEARKQLIPFLPNVIRVVT